jgi:tight adherence protein B
MSLPQAIRYAATESRPPLRVELTTLVDEVEVGVPLGDAIGAWAERVATDDVRLVAATMELHRRVGGDLPAVLDQVAASVRERVGVAREVRALTAQARLSGGILGALPVGFFAFLWLTSRTEMQAALSTPAGVGVVVLGLVLDGLAFLWIRKLLEVT